MAENVNSAWPSKAEEIIYMAGVLVPEAGPALQLFGLLEPEIQKGFAALITLAHQKQPSAQDFLAQAQKIVDGIS